MTLEHDEQHPFDDSGALRGQAEEALPDVPVIEGQGEEVDPNNPDGKPVVDFDDMDKEQEPHTTSDAEAKLKVADYIVRPNGKYNLRQMSRVTPAEENPMVIMELQTETHKLLTGQKKGNGNGPLLFGDMLLDIKARYSRARDGGLIVDALKVIQIESEKEEDSKGPHWG